MPTEHGGVNGHPLNKSLKSNKIVHGHNAHHYKFSSCCYNW